MSLYNALFGRNPFTAALLAIVDLPLSQIPRFRDVSVSEDRKHVVVMTRTGGGNREEHESDNNLLAIHPRYVSDRDDEFDSTYAYFWFSIPEAALPVVYIVCESMAATDRPLEKFEQLFAKMKAGDDNDPEVKRALAIGRKIFETIVEAPGSGVVGI